MVSNGHGSCTDSIENRQSFEKRMAIYEISADSFRKIDETSFSSADLRERQDLQRLLRSQIDIVSPDTLVIAEEFSQWEDSNRQIDLPGRPLGKQSQ